MVFRDVRLIPGNIRGSSYVTNTCTRIAKIFFIRNSQGITARKAIEHYTEDCR